MGYRSEICIGVFFKDKAQMDEILAIYAMQEQVQKCGRNEVVGVWGV
jgi:hypothetical protein